MPKQQRKTKKYILKKRNTKKHILKNDKKQKGGLLINNKGKEKVDSEYMEESDLIKETIKNSTFKLLSESSLYGLIFLGTINDDEYCYFKDSMNNPIKKYILKGSFIKDEDATLFLNDENLKEKQTVYKEEFDSEIENQAIIYKRSLETYNTSIVPDIQQFSTSFKEKDLIKPFIKNITNQAEQEKMKEYMKHRNGSVFHIYIMKYLENYYTYTDVKEKIHKLEDKTKVQELSNILLFIYIFYHLLLSFLNYHHKDANPNNIMIYYDEENPEDSLNEFKAYIIDFGIGDFNMTRYKQVFNKKNIQEMNTNNNMFKDEVEQKLNSIIRVCFGFFDKGPYHCIQDFYDKMFQQKNKFDENDIDFIYSKLILFLKRNWNIPLSSEVEKVRLLPVAENVRAENVRAVAENVRLSPKVEKVASNVEMEMTKPYIKNKILQFIDENFNPTDKDLTTFVNSLRLHSK